MNKVCAIAILTLTCLISLDLKATAQHVEVAVTVPFEFVAGGQILPAGKYVVSRSGVDAHSGITIRGNNHSALLLPVLIDATSAQQPGLSLERIDGEYFLSKIEAPQGVYTFEVPRATATLARTKNHSAVSAAGGD